jgi:hypothetical protein
MRTMPTSLSSTYPCTQNSTQGRTELYSTELIVLRGGPGFDPLGLAYILPDNLWDHKIVVLKKKIFSPLLCN